MKRVMVGLILALILFGFGVAAGYFYAEWNCRWTSVPGHGWPVALDTRTGQFQVFRLTPNQ
jgi:hypothetical protein